jgi:hypothetical protein
MTVPRSGAATFGNHAAKRWGPQASNGGIRAGSKSTAPISLAACFKPFRQGRQRHEGNGARPAAHSLSDIPISASGAFNCEADKPLPSQEPGGHLHLRPAVAPHFSARESRMANPTSRPPRGRARLVRSEGLLTNGQPWR